MVNPWLQRVKNPLYFLVLLCSLQGFYLLDGASWWLWVLAFQLILGGLGLWVRSWRLYGLVTLGLLFYNVTPWVNGAKPIPNCENWTLRGKARVVSASSGNRVQLIQVQGICQGVQHQWLVSEVDWPSKRPWLFEGDHIEIGGLRLIRSAGYGATFEPLGASKVLNLSGLEKKASRSTLLVTLQAKARTLLSPESLALYKALITADRSDLTREDKRRFKELGIAHLLAISGMHTGIVFLWIHLVLRLVLSWPIRQVRQGWHLPLVDGLSLALLFSFLWVIGLPVSALRAWLMLVWWMGNKHWFHHQTPAFILAGTAQVILLLEPWAIGQISFQLSFLSVAGILWLLPFLPNPSRKNSLIQRGQRFIVSSLMISFWLFILNFVVVAQITEAQSWASPINNLIHITAVASFVLPLYLLGLGVSVLSLVGVGSQVEVPVFWLIEQVSQLWGLALQWTGRWNHPFLFRWELDWSSVERLCFIALILSVVSGLKLLKKTPKRFK